MFFIILFISESFVARNKAKMKGALAGLTRPTTVASILAQIEMTEKIFFSLFDQVAMYGTLTSRLAGAQYIPNIYARSQVIISSFNISSITDRTVGI